MCEKEKDREPERASERERAVGGINEMGWERLSFAVLILCPISTSALKRLGMWVLPASVCVNLRASVCVLYCLL